MPNYDFARFDPLTFEQFVQSVANAVLGAGTMTWGAGPDGGREATTEGRLPFPHPGSHEWDGYVVVQAKHKAKLQDSTTDGRWAVGQLRAELESWYQPDSRRARPPEYFIFVTNVELTPDSNGGSLDSVIAILDGVVADKGLKGYAVWHQSQLRTFLDGVASDVRRTYAAWTLPGDVLSELLDQRKQDERDLTMAVAGSVAKELTADQFASLTQGGHGPEAKAALGSVFIDLPMEDADIGDQVDQTRVLEYLIVHGDRRCVGATREHGGRTGRFVLVGGPGQGKSTVGQLLCQAYRVAFTAGLALSPEATDAREGFAAGWEAAGLPTPKARRWPVRVVLSRFADALADGDAASLLDYVAQTLSQRSGIEIRTPVVLAWLRNYPWLLVLDGLDEVPASSNRGHVMRAISDFWQDVAQADADVLVLATTRPQGYNEEFSPRYYTHRTLTPLPTATALLYADRLASAVWGGDSERALEIGKRLRMASADAATQKLLESPLQVTIMCYLVDRLGEPPRERYELFSEYYRVIYQRELEKGGPHAAVLRRYRADVDYLHSIVGLVLQMRSERRGENDARLPLHLFRDLVDERLSVEGHTGRELTELGDAIIAAAADRLVFLVGVREDFVGFEIRSLQEYMAAEALSEGTDVEVRARLEIISGPQHWRNVFLFVAGRIFSRKQYLRDTMQALLMELDTQALGTVLASDLLATGGRLASALLSEGVAARQPRHRASLASRAVEVLRAPTGGDVVQMASAISDDDRPYLEQAIERALAADDLNRRKAAWHVLAVRADSGDVLSEERLARAFENPVADGDADKMASLALRTRRQALLSVVAERLEQRGYMAFLSRHYYFNPHEEAPPSRCHAQPPVYLQTLLRWRHARPIFAVPLRTSGGADSGVAMWLEPVVRDNSLQELCEASDLPTSWAPLRQLSDFLKDPSPDSLSGCLRALHAPGAKVRYVRLPWILDLTLRLADRHGGVNEIVQRVLAGGFGDLHSWMALEHRLRAGADASLVMTTLVDLGISAAEDVVLAELGDISPLGAESGPNSLFVELIATLRDLPPGTRRRVAGKVFASLPPGCGGLSPSEMQQLLDYDPASAQRPFYWLSPDLLQAEGDAGWLPLIAGLGAARAEAYPLGEATDELFRLLLQRYIEQPFEYGFAELATKMLAFVSLGPSPVPLVPHSTRAEGRIASIQCRLVSSQLQEDDTEIAVLVAELQDADRLHTWEEVIANMPFERRTRVLNLLLRADRPMAAEVRQALLELLDRAQDDPLETEMVSSIWLPSGLPTLALSLAAAD